MAVEIMQSPTQPKLMAPTLQTYIGMDFANIGAIEQASGPSYKVDIE